MTMRFRMGGGPRGGWEGRMKPFIAMSFGPGGRGWGGDWDFGNFSFEGGGRGGRGGGGRGPRGRRRMFDGGELRLVLLALIEKEPRHGYDLIKAIEEMTGGDYAPSPGAVYPTLQLLEDEGSIEEAEAEGAKKPFAATAQGLEELEDRRDEVKALLRRLGRHGERTTTVRSHDVFRAMGNLGSVLKNRAKAGKLDEETINQIVDMIDEMAKRIERL